jgi:hypothetical protein
MTDDSPVITVAGYDQGIAVQTAIHRSMPELRARADTPQSALGQLAARLLLSLDCVIDDFHRDPIRRALGDVDRVRLGR